MRSRAAFALAIVCEAPADGRTASQLADRVLVAEVDWLEVDNLDLHRRWQGAREGSSHLEWHQVPRLARHQHVSPHGQFQGEPGALDAQAARKALLLKAPGVPRNAKRVLGALVGDDADREAACWTECGLEVLAERGRLSGLAGYLEEIRRELVPWFSGRG